MTGNDKYFRGLDASGSYLAARGFDARGNRSGGILAPKEVELPPGSILFRLYTADAGEFGSWWSTAYELGLLLCHFARGGPAFAEGREHGKGILHAALGIRHDWDTAKGAKPSPRHLSRFICASTTTSLNAYYGTGDDAPSADQQVTQKPAKIITKSRTQAGVRQLFLPKCSEYHSLFKVLDRGWSDTELISAVRRRTMGPLPFE